MTRKVSAKGAKKRADDLFSKIVRARGRCENCATAANLQCAHIMSRRFSNTRCDEANAFCLCAGCHLHFTDHPIEFARFVLSRMSESEYDDLYRMAHDTTARRVDWDAVAAELRARLSELEAAA